MMRTMTTREGIEPSIPSTMRAIRLLEAGGIEHLSLEQIPTPMPGAGEVLVRVHAAAITKDELEWPVDRLPATPSYELSGVVAAPAPGVDSVAVGESVFALTGFDRDGAAADYVAVAAEVLAPMPRTLEHVASAAIPLAGLSAWQGLFDHGHLEAGQRVVIQGAAGGVGHLATQLARWRGAHVIGTASPGSSEAVRGFGAHEVLDRDGGSEGSFDAVDLVFDTVGGRALERSPSLIREGGRLVSVAEGPPEIPERMKIGTSYFVVEPNGQQLGELARLADSGELRPSIDSTFPLADARSAFRRSLENGKRGKVVLKVAEEATT
jgi:NADPH:quinone reductase-like Zn-dependent oxidoreductase